MIAFHFYYPCYEKKIQIAQALEFFDMIKLNVEMKLFYYTSHSNWVDELFCGCCYF